MSEAKFNRRLILEIEVPEMYVEDVPELVAEHGFPGHSESEGILNCIGEPQFCLLTAEYSGEKDSDVVTSRVIVRAARIEDKPPTDLAHLDRSFEALEERRDGAALEQAHLSGYEEGLADGKREATARAKGSEEA